MTIRLGDLAPDFSAETTQGTLNFHTWKGDQWAILFSHPRDFTPVCTTELGTMAGLKAEFDKRDTKVLSLSVDPLDSHQRWKEDIQEVSGNSIDFPIGCHPSKLARRRGCAHRAEPHRRGSAP